MQAKPHPMELALAEARAAAAAGEVPVGAVQQGATVRQKTFVGHTFVARVRGELVGRYTVAGDESTVEFTANGGFVARRGSSSAAPPPEAAGVAPPPGLERERDL